MRALGRKKGRGLVLAQALGAVAASLAANLAWAGAPEVEPNRRVSLLSPETLQSFAAVADVSPLVAALNTAHTRRDDIALLNSEPRFDLSAAPGDGAGPAKGPLVPRAGFAASEEPRPSGSPGAQENPTPTSEPPAAPPLSPMQSALEAATERLVAEADQPNPLGVGDWRAARAAIAFFYAARDYAPVWVDADGLTQAGQTALAQLKRAKDDGLRLPATALTREVGADLSPDALAETETAISAAVVIYAEQATGSRVPPARVSPLIFSAPSPADPGAALAETAAAPDPAQRLQDFNPPQKAYRDLREEWKRVTEAAPSASGPGAVPAAEPRPRKAAHPARPPAGARIHTASADPAFAFGSFARRRAAILANMEMWRWEPRDMGERRIEVNVADFSVAVMQGDEVVHQARVIVGKPETPTPIFSSVMRYVIINPSWQVPDSIIKKELMPKLGALSRRGYEVKTVGGRLVVRQLPGEDNALGRIAFMFPNDHAVYLHDTPARELFNEDARAFSHGCVRVEDPLSLAEIVLDGGAGKWTAERIEGAVGGPERTVFLPSPLPIHIEYFTEFFDEFGELRERPDIYGVTRKVEGILAQASQD
jgi:murein L,D-transpeptidase YcbB/YkuD